MEAGFDENNQFQCLIIDPGDIKTEQNSQEYSMLLQFMQIQLDIMQETPQPKNSALYWTGSGMSISRVISGTTKRQQNRQGHKRVNYLKIEKRHKWVTYFAKQKELIMTDTYNKDRLRRIKNKQKQIVYGHVHHRDVAGSISTMILNPNKTWMECKKSCYLT
jgi:hypothetical protein